MLRKTFSITAIFLLIATLASFSQTSISGIINNYWQVTSVDFCSNKVALPAIPLGIANGDKVLLIQMTGAEIDLTDAASYGSIIDYLDAGNYEVHTISDISFNIITFQETMLRTFDAVNGKVQMVQIPQYIDVSIDGILTAPAWDGTTGGVLIFEASGTVTFNADADVTGLGFRGGAVYHNSGCFGGGTGSSNYRCDVVDECGGSKGEGIADNGGFELGRGAPANGGGGGNDDNTGGGGGSNFGTGGAGGQRLNTTAADCQGPNPGIGGYALSYTNAENKVFMGGGGGSGDDNTNEGTPGANGGGIVIIKAGTINGNSFSIFANGASQAGVANLDGGGGGGGGGAILLDAINYSSTINAQVNGGNGGNVDNGGIPDSCFGPGGGGAAGMLWVSGGTVSANILLSASAGSPGLTVNGNAPVACNGLSNGATAGSAGGSLTGLVIPQSTVTFIPLTLSVSNDTTVCKGTEATLTAYATGTGALTYNWSNGSTDSSTTVSPTAPTEFTITVTDSRGCSLTTIVNVNVDSNSVSAIVYPDSIIVGSTVQLVADTTGNEFFAWYPSTGITDITIYNPVATPPDTTEYCVIATGYNGCIDTACVTVNVVIPEPAVHIPTAFTPNGDGLNDTWQLIIHPCYTIEEVYIYNRWGQVIFVNKSTTSVSWNGTFQGTQEPIGAYPYYIRAKCSEHVSEEIYKGTVTIIR